MKKGKGTCPDITSPAMMKKCEDTKHNHNNYNEIETSLDIMDNGTEKFPDIIYPAKIEEYVNNKYDDNNENETDASMNTMNCG